MGHEAALRLKAFGLRELADVEVVSLLVDCGARGWLKPMPTEAARSPVMIPDLGLQLLWIAPGIFTMGSPDGEGGLGGEESPLTEVTIPRGFWLGQTEVTQSQWQAVVGGNPSHFEGGDRPVEQVSWDDAMRFCRKLTDRERSAGRLPDGYEYSLPTEAQWEYACRAETEDDAGIDLPAIAWYALTSPGHTHAVARKQPNTWRLHDMLGNVYEWCEDWYVDHLPGGAVVDPVVSTTSTSRVVRGGSYHRRASECRPSSRYSFPPARGLAFVGFRVALRPVR